MIDSLTDFLSTRDWAATVQGAAALWMAIVATFALRTWRSQMAVRNEVEFLDEIVDTVHEFILLMKPVVSGLSLARMGFESYSSPGSTDEHSGVIAFIEQRGQDTSERILNQLRAVKPVLSKMQSLAVKGQIFGMKDYETCRQACTMLKWSHDQIEAFCGAIESPFLNWNHPDIRSMLVNVKKIDPRQIADNLEKQSEAVVLFAKSTYGATLGRGIRRRRS